MAQIAQQTPFVVVSPEALSALDETSKEALKERIKAGIILDCVIKTTEAPNFVGVSKVIGYQADTTLEESPTYKVYAVSAHNSTKIVTINID